jgi:4-amino-4-deoxy-L-arabinose transferase-like glycosyltransferase
LPRLLILDRREAWLDEACTGLFAASDTVADLFAKLVPESHPPLYYLFMQAWTGLFGYSDAVLRLPSVLGGLALVFLVWKIARLLELNAFYRVLAAGAAALMPVLIYYSVEAKSYTILWALMLVALHECLLLVRPDSRRPLWPAVLALTAAAYTHYFGLLALLAPLALLAFGPARRRALVLVALPLALYLPWALGFFAGQAASGGTAWLARYQLGVGDMLLATLRIFTGSGPYPTYLGELAALKGSGPLGMVLVFTPAEASLLLLLPGAWDLPRLRELRLLVVFFLASLLLPLLYSLYRPMYLPGRYELGSLAPFLLLWVLGLRLLWSRLPRRQWPLLVQRGATLVTLLGLLAVATAGFRQYVYLPPEGRPGQQVAAALGTMPPKTGLVVTGLSFAPVAWALRTGGVAEQPRAFPPSVEVHPGWYDALADADPGLRQQADELVTGFTGRPVLLVGRRGQGALAYENRHWNLLEDTFTARGWTLESRLGFSGLSAALLVPTMP